MLFIISLQKTDSIGDVMFKLNEYRVRQKFTRKERAAFVVYIILCVVVTAGKFTWLFVFYVNGRDRLKLGTMEFNILFSDECGPVFLMGIIFSSLLYQLYNYFNF